MEYSKDIVLGVKFFNGEDKHENLKVEGIRENKYDKAKEIVKKISKATINKEKICKVEINNKNKVVKYKVVYNLYNNIKDNNVDTSTRKYISKLYGYSNDNSENIIMFTKEAYVENDIVYDLDGKLLDNYNSKTINKILDNATLKKYIYKKDSKEYKLVNE